MDAGPIGARRSAILTAAAALFAKNGFQAVSMAEIGVAAGMSAASLYRFFDGKRAILGALWDAALSEVLLEAERAVAESTTPERGLDAILRVHAELLVTKYGDIGTLVRRGHAGLNQADREVIEGKEAIYLALWAAQLQELLGGSRDETLTRVFIGLAILHSVATSLPQYSGEALIDQLVAMAKAGVLAEVPPSAGAEPTGPGRDR